jgi:hypothetical protein
LFAQKHTVGQQTQKAQNRVGKKDTKGVDTTQLASDAMIER